MSLNILHLSDLHLGKSTDAEDLAAKIHNSSIENKISLRPTTIIVTGDIFEAVEFSSDDYTLVIDNAVKFFKCLATHFEIDDFCEHLFFVPGNHELNRESVKAKKHEEQFNRYREFLEKIYSDNWETLKNSVYDNKELCFVKHFENNKVIIVGLNSSRFEESKKATGTGQYVETSRIGNTQINAVHKLIKNIEGYDDNRVIACFHNNIYNTIERTKTENVDSTCVQDNEALLSVLHNYNCSLVLHGHKHQLKNRRINLTQDIKEKDNLCTVISGGTLKGLSTDSFNYLEIYDINNSIDLVCREFCDEGGIFKLSAQFSIPVQEDMRRFSKIEDAVRCDPQLFSDYIKLKDSDTVCDDKLLDALDSTLCAFKEISDNFFLNQTLSSDVLYVVLGAMHYRTNAIANGAFLEQSKNFIKKATDKIELSGIVFKMLQSKDAWDLCDTYEDCKNNIHSIEQKKTLIFLALTIYLSDFFLTVKHYPDEFYDKYIQQKANYKLNDVDIRTTISGNTINFAVNDEHRSLEITVRCSTANSHKVISLIVKEFELILSKFEEDFASVGFRVYYIFPKIMKLDIDDEKLESYEFAAYIPRLIPLLAGRNIYTEPEAFTRELIQNSIDAIKVRAKREGKNISGNEKIKLEIKSDVDTSLRYFRISDEGTGMNRYVLERYLTTIGRSFYTGNDFLNLGIKYSPISQFGIGFLSCFMLGKHVEVRTTHFENANETFYLDIPNYDGCFFIEAKKIDPHVPGSVITVWENEELRKVSGNEFDIGKIKDYIKKIICNIPFDITINNNMFIPKYNYNNQLKEITKVHNLLFFIPIASDPDDNGNTLVDKTTDKHTEHGIYFYKRDDALFGDSKITVMNNGILVGQSSIDDISRDIHPYLDVAFNLPSHALELEVSRDKLKHLKGFEVSPIKELLIKRIREYFDNKSAKNMKYAIWCLLDFEAFNLTRINMGISNDAFIINMDKHTTHDEFANVCKLINRLDMFINEEIVDANSSHTYFKRMLDERYFQHIGFNRILDLFEHTMRTLSETSVEENINNFHYQFLFNNIYTGNGYIRDIEESMQRIGHIFYKDSNKFPNKKKNNRIDVVLNWLLVLSVSTRAKEGFGKHTDKFMLNKVRNENDISVKMRTILVLGVLKPLLSKYFSYKELDKGITIPLNHEIISDVFID